MYIAIEDIIIDLQVKGFNLKYKTYQPLHEPTEISVHVHTCIIAIEGRPWSPSERFQHI